jgi:hypothetical protein
VVFAAIVALGAGLQLAAETTQHQTHISEPAAAFAVAIPVAVYLVAVALLHGSLRPHIPASLASTVLTAAAILIVAAGAFVLPLPAVILLMGAVVAALVATHVSVLYRRA